MSQDTQQIILRSARMLAPATRHLVFSLAAEVPFSYVAGQFISIHIEREGKMVRRNFSIANPPKEGGTLEIDIACSYVPGGLATNLLGSLEVGQALSMSGPYGQLVLRASEAPKRYILVATGTGVTPYRAMLPEIVDRFEKNVLAEVVLLFGVREPGELLYGEEFREFSRQHPKFKFIPCFSRTLPAILSGFEKKGHVQTALPDLNLAPQEDIVYLCGNPNMIDEIFTQLVADGFDRKSVRREKYISSP